MTLDEFLSWQAVSKLVVLVFGLALAGNLFRNL